jgi:NAD-dependent deacetylase sirtuin 7
VRGRLAARHDRLLWREARRGDARARAESAAADVAIFLGTSLRALQHHKFIWAQQHSVRKRIAIVTLQWKPKDKVADLKINGRCDAVLAQLLAARVQ